MGRRTNGIRATGPQGRPDRGFTGPQVRPDQEVLQDRDLPEKLDARTYRAGRKDLPEKLDRKDLPEKLDRKDLPEKLDRRTYRRNWTARTYRRNWTAGPIGLDRKDLGQRFRRLATIIQPPNRVDDTGRRYSILRPPGHLFFTSPSSIVTITETGYYKIDFQVSASTGGVWGIALDVRRISRALLTRSANNQISGNLMSQ